MKKNNNISKNSIVMQGSILVMASIIVRLIGFIYRIPLVRMLGDEGMGYYSVAFQIYSFVLVISSYGIPIAVSKLISAKISLGEHKNAHHIFKGALLFALISGGIGASVIWFGADFFANMMNTPLAANALRVLAPTILIVAFLGVLRGYFQGMNTMVPTALSQIIEQVLNAVISILAAWLLIGSGLHWGAAGGTIGTGVGALFGLLFMIVIYMMIRPMLKRKQAYDSSTQAEGFLTLQKTISLTIVPIILGTTVFQLTNIMDAYMFNSALAFQGFTENQVASYYGILDGKYKVIINLPISLGSALAAATVPSIATSLVSGHKKEINHKVNIAIRFIMLIAIPAAVGALIMARPILMLLFNETNPAVANMLRIGSITIVFFCLSTISVGILQGLDRITLPVKHSAIAMSIKIVVNILLLFVLQMDLYGIIISNIIFSVISAYLNLKAVKKITGIKLNIKKAFIMPLICSSIMGIVVFAMHQLLYYITNIDKLSTVSAIVVGIGVYGILVIKTNTINKRELLSVPLGHKILKICLKLKIID
ncbi:stage V sporulation protein B [Natranaerovirga hydrolytica]|uniref:Stage V sporulation protein B n=1 Tax=Natranaerovirga hydrolytica TaxID=680378 RepID=A0A4R1MYM8_9FIRM|nr:polysaccharide biosynthesis protein [Natranaerovirga hydrolytica]TCK98245.1 stage V sporulation protein B [Natranaerovirga hydrolytica]